MQASNYPWNIPTKEGQYLITDEVLRGLQSITERERALLPLRRVFARYCLGGAVDWYLLDFVNLEQGIFLAYRLNRRDPDRSEFCEVSIQELAKGEYLTPIHSTEGGLLATIPLTVERDGYFKPCYFGEIDGLPKKHRELLNIE